MRETYVFPGGEISETTPGILVLPKFERPYNLFSIHFLVTFHELSSDNRTYRLDCMTGDLSAELGEQSLWSSVFPVDNSVLHYNRVLFSRGGDPGRAWQAFPLGIGGTNGVGWLPPDCQITPDLTLRLSSDLTHLTASFVSQVEFL